ncbi:hypothetical protein GCM10011380_13410 [Sphingomonas metalli]|uniref:M23ase beta-sheet core domain-containing protein n=1 Tax=Sphingomonas metalli TaxID=1779358 RepID=A0A916SZT7_9SPHN|nr:peptidoglycan DD-metalloendopeptidase family protein [Sphingomonas metalli]GGB25145.1 hypothetical protein GCM10011380_13410 [Sphingomonas metalli]
MRLWAIPVGVAVLLAAGVAAQQIPVDPAANASLAAQRQRLAIARREAALASQRAERLLLAAAMESDAAGRAATEQQGLAERVAAAQAGLEAAEARAAIVARLLATRRAALAEQQTPLARLLAAMQSLTMRPAAASLAQPGSVDDLVHLRAVLSSVIPAIRQRTAGIRSEVAETRALRTRAVAAGQALRAGRRRLDTEQAALAAVEAQHRARAAELGQGALTESDRALALGENARDLIEQMEEAGRGQAVVAILAQLPAPTPRAVGEVRMEAPPSQIYRLPVEGQLVTGFGEISDAGVRSRGLTFAVAPEAEVVAPADGTVRYAGHFRGYGRIVIIDHGGGWTSLVTGMGPLSAVLGQTVRAGDALGRAATVEEPRVTVELRRRGEPIDAAALIG